MGEMMEGSVNVVSGVREIRSDLDREVKRR